MVIARQPLCWKWWKWNICHWRFPNMVKVKIHEHWTRGARFNPLWVSGTSYFEKLVLNIKIFYCKLQVEVAHVVTIVGRFLSKLWLPSFCLVISWNLNHICVQFVDFFALQNIFNIQVKVASLRSATLIILARIALAWRLIVVLIYYTPTSILWKLNSFRLAIISLKSLKC